MKFYISDLHFGHQNAIVFDQRPFSTVEEMDETIITLWNRRVTDDDDVYIIGDFAFRNQKPEEWYLSRLNGRKNLIIGNHDGKLLKNETAMSYFMSVEKMKHVSDQGAQFCLCHCPIADWNGMYRGAYHIFGHIHREKNDVYQYMKTRIRALNAGCMIHQYQPVGLQELIDHNWIFFGRGKEEKGKYGNEIVKLEHR